MYSCPNYVLKHMSKSVIPFFFLFKFFCRLQTQKKENIKNTSGSLNTEIITNAIQ